MTRVVRFHEFGSPDVLRIEDLEVGEPGAAEVRIRVQAIGLNRAEAAFRSGHYIEKAVLPARLGYEAAAVVEAIGSGVSGLAIGEPVCVIPQFSMNQYGVYAERAIVPAASLVKRPSCLGTAAAAAVWMPYLTAYGALIDIVGLRSGDAIIITAASSSVGLAAIQIANSVGAVPIAVTRSSAKCAGLLAEGAKYVIASETQDVAAETMRITDGKGAKMAFDPIGGPAITPLVAALSCQGTLILYGNLSGAAHRTVFPFGAAVGRGLSLRGYLVFEIIHDRPRLAAAESFIRDGLDRGVLTPKIDRTFAFDDIVAAHRYLESNQQLGKVVVTLGD